VYATPVRQHKHLDNFRLVADIIEAPKEPGSSEMVSSSSVAAQYACDSLIALNAKSRAV
jgi:hypothetical protein